MNINTHDGDFSGTAKECAAFLKRTNATSVYVIDDDGSIEHLSVTQFRTERSLINGLLAASVSNACIERLYESAGSVGDAEMVRLCRQAVDHQDRAARTECGRAVEDGNQEY